MLFSKAGNKGQIGLAGGIGNLFSGCSWNGFDRAGYDKDGFDASGYDRDGNGRSGLNADGWDRRGMRTGGSRFDSDGYDALGPRKAALTLRKPVIKRGVPMLNIERLYREWPVFRDVVDAMAGDWRSENDKAASLDVSTREWLFEEAEEGEGQTVLPASADCRVGFPLGHHEPSASF